MNFYLSYKKNHEFIYTFTTYQTVSRSMQMAFNSNYAQKKYTAEQFLLCFIRLTWSLPPHSPAGRFAHKPCSPLLLLSTLSAGLTSKPHHAHNFSLLMWIVLPATGLDFQPQTRYVLLLYL